VEPAARRDLHHRRPGDPGPGRRRDDRGLRLAPHPALALAGHLLDDAL